MDITVTLKQAVINKTYSINTKYIDLSQLSLLEIPPEILKIPSLVNLNVAVNQLTKIPDILNLITLCANHNLLTVMNISGVKLDILYLHNNQINRISPKIRFLTNLSVLTLSHNLLKLIPPEIGELTNLTTLRLDNNQLIQIPNEINKLVKLNTLTLTNNNIKFLPNLSIPHLDFLHLNHNKIKFLLIPTIHNITISGNQNIMGQSSKRYKLIYYEDV